MRRATRLRRKLRGSQKRPFGIETLPSYQALRTILGSIQVDCLKYYSVISPEIGVEALAEKNARANLISILRRPSSNLLLPRRLTLRTQTKIRSCLAHGSL